MAPEALVEEDAGGLGKDREIPTRAGGASPPATERPRSGTLRGLLRDALGACSGALAGRLLDRG